MEPFYDTIERQALNQIGGLGSLYDAYRDRVIEQNNLNAQELWSQTSRQLQCKLISGAADASNNLLKWIGIQNELRLSLLLGSASRSGIAAVMEYSYCIDQSTRFLYYSWIKCERELGKIPQIKEMSQLWAPHIDATHIITGVRFGIDVLVIIQLPPNANITDRIDSILKKILNTLLKENHYISDLTVAEIHLLDKSLQITVYSNIPTLTDLHKISDLLYSIKFIKANSEFCYPVTYILSSITSLYPVNMRKGIAFKALPSTLINDIEDHILQFVNEMKYVEATLTKNVSQLLCHHDQHILDEFLIQFSQVKHKYIGELQELAKLVVDSRREPASISKIYQVLGSVEQIRLNESINDLIKNLKAIKANDRSITNVGERKSKYSKTTERNLDKSNKINTIEPKPVSDDQGNRSLDSSSSSNKNHQLKFANQRQRSTEKDKNDAISPENVNIPVSLFEPKNIAMPSSDKTDHSGNHSQQQASLSNLVSEISQDVPSPSPIINDSINILLLGETGVGKSTFINAFANYLAFNSLEQAQANEPIVIIPVSFIMTVGDHFEEHTIKFGEIDSSNNENFNKVGQSVTQHCKSYVFDLHQFDGRKMRIIDTPGFGDTQGLDQDDRNMEHILQYIHNLSHLNAICFLVKPNSSRLNIFFRTCLTQLFSFLAPTVRENVIFCFTNARSTFYTPGDTAPLLKKMLASSTMTDIPFGKDNAFCFDSESFRYLVALRNRIPFTKEVKHKCEKIWSASVKESNRLINYIDTKLILYHMDNGYQSIKHAQFEISHMIRPLLEAMRNFLRNIILYEKNFPDQLIELHPKALHRIAIRCRSCKRDPHMVGKFWIVSDLRYEIQTEFSACSCAPDQRVPIDYMLEYELSKNASEYDSKQMTTKLRELCEACAKFAHFLMRVACSTKDDPFLIGLAEMIAEESDICKSQTQTVFNQKLVEGLKNLYEQLRNKMKPDQECINLPAIYKSIKSIGECIHVREQMVAVKRTQQLIMKQHEYEPQKI